MQIYDSFFDNRIDGDCAVTVGKFDGLHQGHRLLIADIVSKPYISCAVTFSTKVTEDKTGSILSSKEKYKAFEDCGLEYLVNCPFDDRIKNTSPEEFIRILVKQYHMRYFCCGTDFTFGYKGAGNVELLRNLSKKMDFELKVYDKLTMDEADISSTRIRKCLVDGDIEKCNELLGYNYYIEGEVVHGRALGRSLGFPTANIIPKGGSVLPAFGVYKGQCVIDGVSYTALCNIGVRPTVSDHDGPVLEAYILDFEGDLYDRELKVELLRFVRGERKFSSIDELKATVLLDIENCRKNLAFVDFFSQMC